MPGARSPESSGGGAAIAPTVVPAFALLFAVALERPIGELPPPAEGILPLPVELRAGWLGQIADLEPRVLGRGYVEARRIRRHPVGRVPLAGLGVPLAPPHADVYLLAHVSGVALFEAWVTAPPQPLDGDRWIEWLDPDAERSLPVLIWEALRPLGQAIGAPAAYDAYFPLSILRAPEAPLGTFLEATGDEVVRLLFLDRSRRRLKPEVVAEELERDYCAREGGVTLLARRSGVDLHGAEDVAEGGTPGLPPRSAVPFLINVEQLLIERTVLRRLHDRLSPAHPGSIEALLAVKQEVLDALEEYYGAIQSASRFSDAVAADGERLLGIVNLYEAVMDRLDAVSFAITTRYQKRMTLLQFWLTVVFGATEIGFIASGIATWYYRAELGAVLGWTLGASVVSGLALVLLLRGKVQ